MNKGPEIRAFKTDMRFRGVNIFIEEERNQRYYLADPVVLKDRTEDVKMFTPTTPSTTLSPTAAQQLIDDLWDCGLRPSEGSGSAGQLAAVERHLEDMQTLVFKGNTVWFKPELEE